MRAVALMTWLQLALTIGLTSVAQLLLKLAAVQPGFQAAMPRGPGPLMLAAVFEPRFVAGLVLYALATMLWVLVLARIDLSLAYPMVGATILVVLALSWMMLGETIGPMRLLGTLLVVAGVICVARPEAA